jgi:hypothetical protein
MDEEREGSVEADRESQSVVSGGRSVRAKRRQPPGVQLNSTQGPLAVERAQTTADELGMTMREFIQAALSGEVQRHGRSQNWAPPS